jgi:hypothetical protein
MEKLKITTKLKYTQNENVVEDFFNYVIHVS